MKKFNAESQTKGNANNESYVSEKYDTKTQRNGYLRFSVSLLISLLVVYLTFQISMPVEEYVAEIIDPVQETEYVAVPYFKVEEQKVEEPEPEPEVVEKKVLIDKFKEVDNDTKIIKQVLITEPEPTVSKDFDPNKVKVIDDVVDEDPVVPFVLVENPPVFPGCEKYDSKKKRRDCMSKKIQKHVSRKFNTDLAQELDLDAGKKSIKVIFKIDKKGNVVEVMARGPHPKLEQEAQRVINMLPVMIPGKQRNSNVKVTYSLPISFKVN